MEMKIRLRNIEIKTAFIDGYFIFQYSLSGVNLCNDNAYPDTGD